MIINQVFRKQINSHAEYIGVVFERDDGTQMFEVRIREADGRGGFKDGKFPVLRCSYEHKLPILADLLTTALASEGRP